MGNGETRKIRRINPLDAAVVVILLASVAGFCLARAGHAGVNKVIKGTTKVDIAVFFVGVKTKDPDLFKVGEPSAFTIRNQPVDPPMTITAVKRTPKQLAFPSPDGKKLLAFTDPTMPIYNDFEVTVSGTADVTDDGFIVRGNKIKVGNQVELEGFKYRLQGVVVDIEPAK